MITTTDESELHFGRRIQDAGRIPMGQQAHPDPGAGCGEDIKLANVLPPMFVSLIISTIWSIYLGLHLLPLLQLNVPDEFRDRQAVARGWWHLAISQVLVLFLLVCYCRAMLTAPGSVPDTPAWKLGAQEASSDIFVPLTQEVKNSGERRHCKWCLKFKPDRCHHCRVCRNCVLKMDHHCPWIMNCVGFRNHKYFFLLVFYAVATCGFVGGTLVGSVQQSVEQEMPSINRFLLVLSLVLTFILGSLMLLFLVFHTYLMLCAMTTIEFCEKNATADPGRSARSATYDLSFYGNLTAVLGSKPFLWLLPICPPDGDGISYYMPNPGDSVYRLRIGEVINRGSEADPEWTGDRRCSM